MIRDYHIHPQILQKPEAFDGFVKTALARGIEEICVTDHMPLLGNTAADRIPRGRVSDYCRRVRELAEQYADRISVKCGIEVDYHPTVLCEIETVLGEGDFDFVLGSSHLHAMPSLHIFDCVHTWTDYAKAMLENTGYAAESGYFHAIAHVNMYQWIFSVPSRFPLENDGFSDDSVLPLIDSVLDKILQNGLRLELNPHLTVGQGNLTYMYPSVTILERALQKGVMFSYGSDAHSEHDIGILLSEIRRDLRYGEALWTWEACRL